MEKLERSWRQGDWKDDGMVQSLQKACEADTQSERGCPRETPRANLRSQ